MKYNISIFTLLFMVSLTLNAQQGFKPDYSTSLDIESGKKLMNQCSRSTPNKVKEFWRVSKADISILEQNFGKLTSLKSSDCCLKKLKISGLQDYGYQYIGLTIGKRRYIYINAFHIDSKPVEHWYKKWELRPIIFCDGGESFWGVLFDIDRRKFKQLSINGI